MTSIHSTAHIPSSHPLLSIGQASKKFGVSIGTLRRADAAGHLHAYRLKNSAHRRFDPSDLYRYLGVEDEKGGVAEKIDDKDGLHLKICAVIRVSSKKQAKKRGEGSEASSLDHQRKRLTQFIREKWGKKVEIIWYERIASGVDLKHGVFLKLVSDLVDRKFAGSFLVCENSARLTRFASGLIEFLAKRAGTQVIYSIPDETDKDDLVRDITDIIGNFSARANGAKSARITRVSIPKDGLDLASKMKCSGFTLEAIQKALQDKGFVKQDGVPFSITCIRKRLLEYSEFTNAVSKPTKAKAASDRNSFLRFTTKFCRVGTSDRIKISRSRLLQIYHDYARNTQQRVINDGRVGYFVNQLGWRTGKSRGGNIVYIGVTCKYSEGTKR